MRSATLDGEALDRTELQHEEFSRSGQLVLEVGDSLSDWGRGDNPPSVSYPEGDIPE